MTEATAISVHPIFAWVLAIGLVMFLVSGYYKKSTTEFAEATKIRRQSKRAQRRGRIEALEEDNKWSIDRIEELMKDTRERDRLAEEHSRWDHEMIMALIRLDPTIKVKDPPPLVPTKSAVTFVKPPGKETENAST